MGRINGEGSWDEYKSGKYVYNRFRIVIDGKTKSFYGKTKTEAMKKYKDYLINHSTEPIKTTLTVVDVANKVIESRKAQIKKTTYQFYEAAIKNIKQNRIGNLQIHSVTTDEIQDYINSLVDKYSLSSIKRQRNLLTITFSYAEDMCWIDKNPMNRVKLPNEANILKTKKECVFLTTEERKKIEKEAFRLNDSKIHNGKIGERLYGVVGDAIVFILHTGLRVGELLALYWEEVDMNKKFIHIVRNAPTSIREITTPKRKSSIRSIPLDSVAFNIIEELKLKQNGEFVFHTKNGQMLNRNNIDRALKQIIQRAGIEKKPTIHDLRHTYASELIRNGIDMKTVQVVLGHSDIATTMNIYVHKSEDDLEILKNILT